MPTWNTSSDCLCLFRGLLYRVALLPSAFYFLFSLLKKKKNRISQYCMLFLGLPGTRYMYVVGWLPGTGNQRYEEHTLIVALPFLFEKNQNLLLLLLLLLLCYRHAEHASLNWSHLLMSHVSIVTALALIFG